MNLPPEAIEAAAKAIMESNECGHGMTLGVPECDYHGEEFVDLDVADVYGFLTTTGTCPVAKGFATAALEAALPHLAARIAQEGTTP